MKCSSIKDLKQMEPASLYLIVCQDGFIREEAVRFLIGGALVKSFDGAHLSLDALFDELDSYSFIEGRRTLVIRRLSEAPKSILKQLVQRAYRKSLDKTADYVVRYGGASKADAAFLVSTVAQSRKNHREEPIAIDYLVHRVDGRWLVRDIVTEGSSLVSNYRRQFTRVIKKDGFGELLRRMRKKLASEKE